MNVHIHTHIHRLVLWWLAWHVPGILGTVLGLVGPVSVYCDWVR